MRDHSLTAQHSNQCVNKAYLSGSISTDEKALSSRKQESKAAPHIWWEAKGAGEIESRLPFATTEKTPRARIPGEKEHKGAAPGEQNCVFTKKPCGPRQAGPKGVI